MVQLTMHFTSDKPFLKYKFGSLAMFLWRKLKVKCIIRLFFIWNVLMENWIILWYFPSQQQFSYLQQIQSGQSSVERRGSLSTNEKEEISAMRKKTTVEQEEEDESVLEAEQTLSPIWEWVSCYVSLQSQSICLSPLFHRQVSPSSPQISCLLMCTQGQSLDIQIRTLPGVVQEPACQMCSCRLDILSLVKIKCAMRDEVDDSKPQCWLTCVIFKGAISTKEFKPVWLQEE